MKGLTRKLHEHAAPGASRVFNKPAKRKRRKVETRETRATHETRTRAS